MSQRGQRQGQGQASQSQTQEEARDAAWENRRKWSVRFKLKSARKSFSKDRRTPRYPVVKAEHILTSVPEETVAGFPEDNTPLSEFVLVVANDIYRDSRLSVLKGFSKSGLFTEGDLELYSLNSSHSSEFKDRFGQETFEVNVLHRLLPFATEGYPRPRKYAPVDRWQRIVDSEQMSDLYWILKSHGASFLLVNKSAHDNVLAAREQTGTLSLPTATPVELTLQRSSEDASNTSSSQMYEHHFSDPEFRPHWPEDERPVHWYYENGRMPSSIRELIEKTSVKIPDNKIRIAFSTYDEHTRCRALQLKFNEIVGVATRTERSELSEFEYVFEVQFFDKDLLLKLPEYRKEKSSQAIEQGRRSLSALATLRTAHWLDRFSFRQDILFPNENGELATCDLEEWMKDYSEATWPEWLSSQGESNTLLVPLVFYGPVGLDNSLAIFTWDAAIRGGPHSYYPDWKLEWEGMIRQPRGDVRSFMQDIRFNPRQSLQGNPSKVNKETYEKLSEKDLVQLVVRDTHDAKDLYKDVQGARFPFGLRILVLDAQSVANAVSVGSNNTMQAKTTPEAKQYLDKVTSLLGELGKNIVEETTTLKRYPPIAAVLLIKEGMTVRHAELMAGFVESYFSISYVFPMQTFESPTDERENTYHEGGPAYRRVFREEWEKVALSAIQTMDNIIQKISAHEFLSWKIDTESKARKKSIFQRLNPLNR